MPSAVPCQLSHAIRETLESGDGLRGPGSGAGSPGSLGSLERHSEGQCPHSGPGCSPHSLPGHLNRRGRAQGAGAAPFLAPLTPLCLPRSECCVLNSEEEEGDMCRGVGRTCQEREGDDNFSHLNYLFVRGKSLLSTYRAVVQVTAALACLCS